MGKTTKTTAEKLQEVIMAKTMNSIAGVPETKSTKKEKNEKKETKKAATKAIKAETPKKEKKEAKKASTPREVKYIYPEDCNSSLEKKKFRAEFRAKVKKFEYDLSKAKEGTKEYKKISQEYKEYKAQYLVG